MSAVAHFLMAWPLRGWYERRLAAGIQPLRWLEYSLSSSVMIIIIATLAGIQEIGTLVAIFGVNAAMNLFGWSMESANQGRTKTQWNHYIFGVVAGIVPWIVITIALWSAATEPGAARHPGFRVGHLRLALHLLQHLRHHHDPAVPQDRSLAVTTWSGEKTYMFMSLFAKTILAWQVFFGHAGALTAIPC